MSKTYSKTYCYGCENDILNQEGHIGGCLNYDIEYFLFTDGASKGNPGKAGGGVVIFDKDDKEIDCASVNFGICTNNEAEYRALIEGVKLCEKNCIDFENVNLRLDSLLIVKQLKGEYKVKSENLIPLFEKVKSIKFKSIEHVRREFNKRADFLANEGVNI
jgi:ribonuclease HI